MADFLSQVFGLVVKVSEPPDPVSVVTVDYVDVDGTRLQGYLSSPGLEWQRPLPLVVILP